MLTELQHKLLKKVSSGAPNSCSGIAYVGKSKIATLLGKRFLQTLKGKTIIDFGCGEGLEAVELARNGAGRVFGIDIRANVLEIAKRHAIAAGVQDICQFGLTAEEPADIIISLDSFEHYSDPIGVLHTMSSLLKPHGKVIAAFGPTWYHPFGGHLFSVFPWAHLVFSEKALIRWRSDFKEDGATKFGEVAGGLNQISIRRFESLVAASPLEVGEMELVPIRKLKLLHNRITREFTTAVVRCQLIRRHAPMSIVQTTVCPAIDCSDTQPIRSAVSRAL
jgi:SAM-dependent methyltransferase